MPDTLTVLHLLAAVLAASLLLPILITILGGWLAEACGILEPGTTGQVVACLVTGEPSTSQER